MLRRIRLNFMALWFFSSLLQFSGIFSTDFQLFRSEHHWRDFIIRNAHLVHQNWYRVSFTFTCKVLCLYIPHNYYFWGNLFYFLYAYFFQAIFLETQKFSAIFWCHESFLFWVAGESTVVLEGRSPHYITFFTNIKDLFEKKGNVMQCKDVQTIDWSNSLQINCFL
jgi:hypothetical protein